VVLAGILVAALRSRFHEVISLTNHLTLRMTGERQYGGGGSIRILHFCLLQHSTTTLEYWLSAPRTTEFLY
jgi:hypothetical protein